MLVFVSHSSLDREATQAVVAALEARGQQCWIASRDVLPGENYQQAIDAAITRSQAMILIFSRNADCSDEIKKELSLASLHRIPVIPVRIENLLPSGGLRYELATRQWIDAFGNWDGAMDRLVGQLGSSPVISPARGAIRPPSIGHRWTAKTTGLLAACVAVLAVGGWYAYDAQGWRLRFPSGGPVNTATQVNAFEIAVTVGMMPKKAEIRRMTANAYAEIDQSGNQTDMAVLGRIMYRGCPGTLLHDGGKYAYFPDRQCTGMLYYISDNGRDFGVASAMTNVR